MFDPFFCYRSAQPTHAPFFSRALKLTFTFVLIGGKIVPQYMRRTEYLEEMCPDHALQNLVHQCLETVPEDRPSAAEIIQTLQKFSTCVEGKSSGCGLSSPSIGSLGLENDASHSPEFGLTTNLNSF